MPPIISATDFSPGSDRAFLRSALLARQVGASLLFAHVMADGLEPLLHAERREAAARALEALCAAARTQHGVDADMVMLDGRPDEALPALATERGSLMLVLGPHDPEPIRDLLVAPMANRLLKRLPCPLLFANGLALAPYQRILLATDLSAASAHAATTASRLLHASSPTYFLYHAFDSRPLSGIAAAMASRDARDAEVTEQRERAEQALALLASAAGIAPLRIRSEPMTSSAADMILEHANRCQADLIVAGTQGKSAAQRLLLGSVAETLLRHTTIDLCLVPPPAN